MARGTGSGSPIPKPAALSITQDTESGIVYREAEIKALAVVARTHELKVHMDGARFATPSPFSRRRIAAHASLTLPGRPASMRSPSV